MKIIKNGTAYKKMLVALCDDIPGEIIIKLKEAS